MEKLKNFWKIVVGYWKVLLVYWKKFVVFCKNKWTKFTVASIIYTLLFVVWPGNLWFLFGLPLIYDHFISRIFYRYVGSKNEALRKKYKIYNSIYGWVDAIIWATLVAHLIHLFVFQLYVQNLINNVKESNPVLVDELIPKLLGIGEVQKVLQNLLREGISIRDLLSVFETLADHAAVTRDTDVLTEYVRQSLRRAISAKFFTPNEMTTVVTLDPKNEQEIMSSVKQTEQGSYIALDPERQRQIIASLEQEIKKMEDMGKIPMIVTSPIVRMYFKKMTQDYFRDLIVISYNEIEPNIELQSVGMVSA